MKYDDASWHFSGDFPSDLPRKNGAIHIAMFFAWAAQSHLLSDIHEESICKKYLAVLSLHSGDYLYTFLQCCDGKLTDEEFSDIGNAFVAWYYKASYFEDYAQVFEHTGDTIYHVEPSWENYDRLKPVLDDRFAEWQAGRT